MKKILPEFKDDTDKMIILILLVASFFTSFLPALICVLFLKKYMSESSYNISKAFFNFELLLFLISLVFFIPIVGSILGFAIGWFVIPVLTIVNIVFIVINIVALSNKSEFTIPVLFEFL